MLFAFLHSLQLMISLKDKGVRILALSLKNISKLIVAVGLLLHILSMQ